ncbi:MAG: L(+)-tartrate dehydratase subunit alpha [Spirochaetaceae bacterium]|jgi:L(+)-tartrate dehydratase alpha subunit|nr:L(+)-tartrate dehydratase subunit alpha [Spirochaetaceae bacterium]
MTKSERLAAIIARFLSLSSIYLSDDVLARLTELRAGETGSVGRRIYDAMFENLAMAEKLEKPCCQDTGVVQFFVRAGTAFPYLAELEHSLREGVIRATASTPLRPNVVECFDEKNTGDNTGTRIPWVDWELVPGSDKLRLYAYLAGGGCSLPGFAQVFMPLEGYEGALKAVFDRIVSHGVNSCPPLLVGIGFAGQADTAAKLSKKALLRTIGERNSNPRAAELEKQLETAFNSIGIGPGGLSGNSSVLAVHIEQAGRHTATLAAALSAGCWAHRRSLIEIRPDLSYEVLSHKRLGKIRLMEAEQ